MLNFIDKQLNRITMYKLLLYYLIVLVLVAMGLSYAGVLRFNALLVGISAVILLITCWAVNKVFAAIFNAPTNVESVYITALILALIIPPTTDGNAAEHIAFLLAASGLAMASKYILTIHKKHIFNPAAIAVVLTAIGPRQSADWWVGTSAMLPYVLLGGVLLVRKIRRGRMVVTFFASTLIATAIYSLLARSGVYMGLKETITTSAMFFLGFIMLTEPLTTPSTARKQSWYAILTGILFPPQFHILSLYSTPELALITSNVFSYVISPKAKLFPTLKQMLRLTPDSADFVFSPNHKRFSYIPGQYMEWTLPHDGVDSRGDRRYFTLASSPTEPDLRIGVKFYNRSSTYKEALLGATPKTPIVASGVSGDFVMPKDPKQKLVFIAGGIGVTPYRSMIKYLLDKKDPRTITMLYSAKTTNDFAYQEVFEEARREFGLNTIYVVSDKSITEMHEHVRMGRISSELIKKEISDYQERIFYISGPHRMVTDIKKVLNALGVQKHQIKLDYFSGYT